MMMGAMIKKIKREYKENDEELDPKDITIISTDCDMFVIGWPYTI